MLVTIWGPAGGKKGDPQIFDYSWREWSGLITSFYLARWDKFHAMLAASIDRGDYRDPGAQTYGRESFRTNAFYSELADWEIAFTHNPPRDLPATPQGDALALARQMMDKYKPALEKAYDPEYQKRLAAELADKVK